LFKWKLKSLGSGRAMAQAVSRRPATAEARVRSWVSPCGICVGQSDTGTGFSASTSVFPCQFHSTGAPLLGKGQKKSLGRGNTSIVEGDLKELCLIWPAEVEERLGYLM
jgi:hypothetical protein